MPGGYVLKCVRMLNLRVFNLYIAGDPVGIHAFLEVSVSDSQIQKFRRTCKGLVVGKCAGGIEVNF